MINLNFFGVALKVSAISLMLSFTSCEYFKDEDGGGGAGKPKPNPPVLNDCSVNGTIVKVTCGTGIFGDYWIKTDDGKLLQPCEQSFQTLCPMIFNEGDKIKLGYRISKKANCTEEFSCNAAIPPHISVIVDCINVVPDNGCGYLFTESLKNNGTVNVIDAKIEGRFLKLNVGYSGCSELSFEKFKLSWDGTVKESLPVQVDLHLTFAEGYNMTCQAYFTQQLCFDISLLKSPSNQQVKLNIQGKEILF